MSKYYKAEDIMEIFSDESRPYNWTGTETEIQEQADFDFYKSQIESLPTINIVHCGECRHWSEEFHDCGIRDSYGWDYKHNDFCSYGERIEHEYISK